MFALQLYLIQRTFFSQDTSESGRYKSSKSGRYKSGKSDSPRCLLLACTVALESCFFYSTMSKLSNWPLILVRPRCCMWSKLLPKTKHSLLFLAKQYQHIRLLMQGWRKRTIYAILKQRPYNLTPKAQLSTQLSSFIIRKTQTIYLPSIFKIIPKVNLQSLILASFSHQFAIVM